MATIGPEAALLMGHHHGHIRALQHRFIRTRKTQTSGLSVAAKCDITTSPLQTPREQTRVNQTENCICFAISKVDNTL